MIPSNRQTRSKRVAACILRLALRNASLVAKNQSTCWQVLCAVVESPVLKTTIWKGAEWCSQVKQNTASPTPRDRAIHAHGLLNFNSTQCTMDHGPIKIAGTLAVSIVTVTG